MVIVVRMKMDMHVFVLVRSMDMVVSMEKFFDNAAMFVIHLASAQFVVQQFVRHQRQG